MPLDPISTAVAGGLPSVNVPPPRALSSLADAPPLSSGEKTPVSIGKEVKPILSSSSSGKKKQLIELGNLPDSFQVVPSITFGAERGGKPNYYEDITPATTRKLNRARESSNLMLKNSAPTERMLSRKQEKKLFELSDSENEKLNESSDFKKAERQIVPVPVTGGQLLTPLKRNIGLKGQLEPLKKGTTHRNELQIPTTRQPHIQKKIKEPKAETENFDISQTVLEKHVKMKPDVNDKWEVEEEKELMDFQTQWQAQIPKLTFLNSDIDFFKEFEKYMETLDEKLHDVYFKKIEGTTVGCMMEYECKIWNQRNRYALNFLTDAVQHVEENITDKKERKGNLLKDLNWLCKLVTDERCKLNTVQEFLLLITSKVPQLSLAFETMTKEERSIMKWNISSLENMKNAFASDVSEMQVKGCEEQIQELLNEEESLRKEVDLLRREMDLVEGDLSIMNEKKKMLTTELDQMETKIAADRSDVNQLQEIKDSLERTCSQLSESLNVATVDKAVATEYFCSHLSDISNFVDKGVVTQLCGVPNVADREVMTEPNYLDHFADTHMVDKSVLTEFCCSHLSNVANTVHKEVMTDFCNFNKQSALHMVDKNVNTDNFSSKSRNLIDKEVNTEPFHFHGPTENNLDKNRISGFLSSTSNVSATGRNTISNLPDSQVSCEVDTRQVLCNTVSIAVQTSGTSSQMIQATPEMKEESTEIDVLQPDCNVYAQTDKEIFRQNNIFPNEELERSYQGSTEGREIPDTSSEVQDQMKLMKDEIESRLSRLEQRVRNYVLPNSVGSKVPNVSIVDVDSEQVLKPKEAAVVGADTFVASLSASKSIPQQSDFESGLQTVVSNYVASHNNDSKKALAVLHDVKNSLYNIHNQFQHVHSCHNNINILTNGLSLHRLSSPQTINGLTAGSMYAASNISLDASTLELIDAQSRANAFLDKMGSNHGTHSVHSSLFTSAEIPFQHFYHTNSREEKVPSTMYNSELLTIGKIQEDYESGLKKLHLAEKQFRKQQREARCQRK